ncbi:histidine kinase [Chryseobacterium terrae]|uniref:Histidine kinase n=1 Tax=Chryseobacterium terrae TaxID=3163299 RepID=A0ABW8Y6V6_9FLAO
MDFYKYIKIIFCIFYLFFTFISCEKKENNSSGLFQKDKSVQPDSFYFDKIAHLDGLTVEKNINNLKLYLKDFHSEKSRQKPVYNIMKSMLYRFDGKKDSALFYLEKVNVSENDTEIKILKFLQELALDSNPQSGVGYDRSSKVFEYIKLAEKHKSKFTFRLYNQMAEIFYLNNKQQESLYYNNLWFKNSPNKDSIWSQNKYYGNCYVIAYHMEDVDTMKVYLDKLQALSLKLKNEKNNAIFYNYEAQYFYFKKDYKKALESSKKFFNYYKKTNQLDYDNYHNLALAFLDNKEMDSALHYFKKAYEFAKKNKEEIDKPQYFQNLAELYDKTGDYKNASIAKDSLRHQDAKFQEKVQNEKLEELKIQYQTEKKDSEIINLNSKNRLNKILLIVGLSLFLSVGLFLYMTYKRKLLKEKTEKLQSENKKLKLEHKALQLQLNPHFIYNSIANLQGLIQQGENQKSVNYLSSFAKLMRNILELNREDFIPLGDEILSISNYMELQQMRFDDLFDYEIQVSENCDTEFVMIPPMLLQPFIENSIEHGFKTVSYKGKIDISFTKSNNKLVIEIKDNGSGIDESKKKNSNKKSLSKTIIQERLDVLFNQKNKESYLEIISGSQDDKGFSVKITIPLIED